MLKLAKYGFYVLIALAVYGLIWFMPKYSYVQKNPGYCTNLTKHLYYCGTKADLQSVFDSTLNSKTKDDIKDKVRNEAQDQLQNQIQNNL